MVTEAGDAASAEAEVIVLFARAVACCNPHLTPPSPQRDSTITSSEASNNLAASAAPFERSPAMIASAAAAAASATAAAAHAEQAAAAAAAVAAITTSTSPPSSMPSPSPSLASESAARPAATADGSSSVSEEGESCDSGPPGSVTDEDPLGHGGCTAVAMAKLGVCGGSVARCTAALDEQIPVVAAKFRKDQRVASFVGEPGCRWHPEVVKMAVIKEGFHFRKVELADRGALRAALLGGGVLIDGVLNDRFKKSEGGAWWGTVPGAVTTPIEDEAGWRHSIAVRGGHILEKEFTMSADYLWLDADGKPDPGIGYFRKVLKAYRVFKCAARRGAGCKGECQRASRKRKR